MCVCDSFICHLCWKSFIYCAKDELAHLLLQVAAGQTRSWLTLSSWSLWAPRWSQPQPPARFAHPTFRMRSSGATSFLPSSLCPPRENMWLILPSLTKWPKPRPLPCWSRCCHHHRHPVTMEERRTAPTRRRCDWRRATVGRRRAERGAGSEIAARWVWGLVMFEAICLDFACGTSKRNIIFLVVVLQPSTQCCDRKLIWCETETRNKLLNKRMWHKRNSEGDNQQPAYAYLNWNHMVEINHMGAALLYPQRRVCLQSASVEPSYQANANKRATETCSRCSLVLFFKEWLDFHCRSPVCYIYRSFLSID